MCVRLSISPQHCLCLHRPSMIERLDIVLASACIHRFEGSLDRCENYKHYSKLGGLNYILTCTMLAIIGPRQYDRENLTASSTSAFKFIIVLQGGKIAVTTLVLEYRTLTPLRSIHSPSLANSQRPRNIDVCHRQGPAGFWTGLVSLLRMVQPREL